MPLPGAPGTEAVETNVDRQVIIADDDLTTLKILERTLAKAGFSTIPVTSGRAVVEHLSEDVCAVILDIQMPEMNGLECLGYINREYPDLAPIMLTASDAVSDAVYAMKHGAFDYIVKPFKAQQITALVEHASRSFEQAVRLRQAEESLREARRNEINVASRVQQALLLGQPPADFPGLEIAHRSIPSQDIDGDFYDFIRLDAENLDLVVADVMGKGIRAAFIGAALKSYFLRVVSEVRHAGPDRFKIEPAEIVDSVYNYMISQLSELESFVTLFYARLCPRKKQLTYVDCGHVRPLHFHHRTRRVSLLEGGNMPLGFPEKEPFRQFSTTFEPEDVFVFYSDGLTETSNQAGELFGEERLIECAAKHAQAGPKALIDAVQSEIFAFSGATEFSDDFTCIGVQIDSEPVPQDLLGRQEFFVDSRMEELHRMRQFIRMFSKKYMRRSADASRIAGIELAAVELTTNIIRHAYGSRAGRPIRIEAIAYPMEMTISFYDRGHGFDPESAPPPVLDGSREGGMGVYIIEKSVDEISYCRAADGENRARMVIRWEE